MTMTLAAFLVYSLAVLGIGLAAARRPQHSAAEIHLGNREHGVWTSALSASASTESGFVLLGMVGMGFSEGASCFWMIPAGILGYTLNWLVLAPRIRKKSAALGAVTVPEFIARSTGSTPVSRLAGRAAALSAIVFLLTYVAAQFSAAGKALSSQFPITYGAGVLAAAAMIVCYAALGGFRAVSWTDNLQALMMVGALVLLPVIILAEIGGIGEMFAILQAKDPALVSLTGGAESIGGILMITLPWLMIGLGYPGQPHGVARLMATRDEHTYRAAAAIAMVWLCIIYAGAILLGMAARASYEHLGTIASDPETALPVLAVELLPGILAGVTLAAITAAISSTADSTLLAASSSVTRDLRPASGKRHRMTELLLERIVLLILTAIATYFAIRQTHIVFSFVLYAFFGLGAALGPTVLYCSLISRPQAGAALAGILTGTVLTFLLQPFELGFLGSFFGSIAVITMIHGVGNKAV